MKRAGWFLIAPTGPGYYSLLDEVTHHWRENPPKYGYPMKLRITNRSGGGYADDDDRTLRQ